ncbi:polyketide cyclase/dehydrase [Lacimicrobium alkaliphilum]|uniref:ATPase n=1 Tax=Lacimicrobium alkaliphilum TaxID=1526571 RepID=A0ABQ1RQ04_9ALTE|nr:polyketide cyclase/dehydrase [Lacimicrobium alkaliphilum]GGD75606.1 ATPase [Lacimicrobium alkaliphilum]
MNALSAGLVPAMVISLSAHAEVKGIGEYGFIIENRVQVATSPEVSWSALVNDVGKWWPGDHSWFGKAENFSIAASAGGCFCEISGENQVQHMQVEVVQPPGLLRMTGGLGPLQSMGLYGALDWKLSGTDTGTEIVLTYKVHGFNPEGFKELAPIVDHVQGLQLGGLKDYLSADGPTK